MDERIEQAIKDLKESGYVVYNHGILFAMTIPNMAQIKLIPWTKVRKITYVPAQGNNVAWLNFEVWQSEQINFTVNLKSTANVENVYSYLAGKFADYLTSYKVTAL